MYRKTSGDQLESGGSEFRWNISEMFDVFVIIKCLQHCAAHHSPFSSSPPIPSKRIPRMIIVIIIIIRVHAVDCENNPFRARKLFFVLIRWCPSRSSGSIAVYFPFVWVHSCRWPPVAIANWLRNVWDFHFHVCIQVYRCMALAVEVRSSRMQNDREKCAALMRHMLARPSVCTLHVYWDKFEGQGMRLFSFVAMAQ